MVLLMAGPPSYVSTDLQLRQQPHPCTFILPSPSFQSLNLELSNLEPRLKHLCIPETKPPISLHPYPLHLGGLATACLS